MKSGKTAAVVFLLFVSSIIANIFFLGYHFGGGAHHMGKGRMSTQLHKTAKELSPEKQDFFRERLREMRQDFRSEKPNMMKLRDEMFDIMTAEEFDSEAYKAKIEELRSFRIQRHQAFSTAMVDIMSGLDQVDRETLALEMRSMHRGRRR